MQPRLPDQLKPRQHVRLRLRRAAMRRRRTAELVQHICLEGRAGYRDDDALYLLFRGLLRAQTAAVAPAAARPPFAAAPAAFTVTCAAVAAKSSGSKQVHRDRSRSD